VSLRTECGNLIKTNEIFPHEIAKPVPSKAKESHTPRNDNCFYRIANPVPSKEKESFFIPLFEIKKVFFYFGCAIIELERMIVKTILGKRTCHKIIFSSFLAGLFFMHTIQVSLFLYSDELYPRVLQRKKTSEDVLKDIYKEVSELGKRKNENFIKREFHFDLDENPTNSEEHIVVLIYDIDKKERMVVQVTYFEAEGVKYSIKYAKDIRLVSCHIAAEKLEIDKCDFNKKEIKPTLKDILKGIQEEKKLFKLIDKKDEKFSSKNLPSNLSNS
jgi:hypothetical protein